jgi:hypothetical protein
MEIKTKFSVGEIVFSETYLEEDTKIDGLPAKVMVKRKRGPHRITTIYYEHDELRGTTIRYHLTKSPEKRFSRYNYVLENELIKQDSGVDDVRKI